MSYNTYDKYWYMDRRFKFRKYEPKKQLIEKEKDEVLFLVGLGQTQRSIAEELGVHESTISTWFKKYVKIRDSKFMFGAVLVPVD